MFAGWAVLGYCHRFKRFHVAGCAPATDWIDAHLQIGQPESAGLEHFTALRKMTMFVA